MYCVNDACVNFAVWDNTDVVCRGTREGAKRYTCKSCGQTFKDRYRVYVTPRPKRTRAAEYKKNESNGKMWCKCPKCERQHWAVLSWAGRGQPRWFCDNCRNNSEPLSSEPAYSINEPREVRHAWT